MIIYELDENNIAIYYKGRKIPTVPLYVTPTVHYIHAVAPHLARRLLEIGVAEFSMEDPRAAAIVEMACKFRCRYGKNGVEISALLEEIYYNYFADRILAYAASADALVVPCADIPLARALARRTREYAPDLLLITSGARCPVDADYKHEPTPLELPIPLGPISRAALSTAVWSIDKAVADAPLTPLLDYSCIST